MVSRNHSFASSPISAYGEKFDLLNDPCSEVDIKLFEVFAESDAVSSTCCRFDDDFGEGERFLLLREVDGSSGIFDVFDSRAETGSAGD